MAWQRVGCGRASLSWPGPREEPHVAGPPGREQREGPAPWRNRRANVSARLAAEIPGEQRKTEPRHAEDGGGDSVFKVVVAP